MLTVIIPFKDKIDLLEKCINSIYKYDAGIPLEILLINNKSRGKGVKKLIKSIFNNNSFNYVNLIEVEDPFNYSKSINMAVGQSRFENILLLNNDTLIKTKKWGDKICNFLNKGKIGCVGIKLLNQDESIQHLGIKLDFKSGAKEITEQSIVNEKEYMGIKYFDTKAVSAAFMAIKKPIFLRLNGMNEHIFPLTFNDVHLSLKAYESGLQNVCITNIKAIHKGGATRNSIPINTSFKIKRRFEKMMIKIRILYHFLKIK